MSKIRRVGLLQITGAPPPVTGTFFLSPTGADGNLGTLASPWLTFAKADSVVAPGSTVTLLPGTYQEEDIVINTSGTAAAPIIWQAQTRHSAIIIPVVEQAGLEVILGDADYIIIDGLQVDGTLYPALLGGITQQGSHTETRNCLVHHIRGLGGTDGATGILTGDGPTADYDQVDNKVYNCQVNDIGDLSNPSALTHGIYLSHVDAQAFNNLIYRVEGGGIHLWHAASDIMIHNNTIFDCRNSGIIAGNAGDEPLALVLSNTKISNNVVIDCPTGIRSSGAQGTGNESRANTCFQCSTPTSLAASWTVYAPLTTNPGMVNYQIDGSGDYHLAAGSQSVNSGFNTWVPSFDYDNNIPRPVGLAADRGAYEFQTDDAGGLISFGLNNTTRYYSIPNSAALNLGSGAWAWGMMIRAGSNAGTDYNYLLSCSALGATPEWNLAWAEISVADGVGFTNRLHFRIGDNAGVDGILRTSSIETGGDSIVRLVVVQSTGTTLEMWLCPMNTLTAQRVVNVAVNIGALTAAIPWNFGRRTDGNAAAYFEREAGNLFKANVALTAAQMQAITSGHSPVAVLGASCAAFWPFANGPTTTEVDTVGGITATRVGTGW